MDEQVERAITFIRDKAKEYAEALAQREYLRDYKKSKLAILMQEAEIEGHKTTSAQERQALANPEYVELLQGLRVATEKEALLRHQIKSAEIRIEIWRTESATRRAEMKGYGG